VLSVREKVMGEGGGGGYSDDFNTGTL
jgi:hypothetical protein